jgi:RNA polymerase sigma factor (sigma-70 family)
MAELSEADRFLLDRILRGDGDAWGQLVARYEGRLLAFARKRLQRKADAEDLVQDVFFSFLQSVQRFKREYSLETFLFTLLRRKLIDVFRGSHLHPCSLHDAIRGGDLGSSGGTDQAMRLPAREATASFYARREEAHERLEHHLATALEAYIDRLKAADNFRDLRIAEMLFYAQLRNKDVARLAGMDEKQIALIKHRAIKEIRGHLEAAAHGQSHASLAGAGLGEPVAASDDVLDEATSLLTDVWERQRPTCPKRSTVGRYLLGTLESPWKEHLDFHVGQLGCRFCQANLDDLRRENADEPRALHERIFQSTVGFLSKAGG